MASVQNNLKRRLEDGEGEIQNIRKKRIHSESRSAEQLVQPESHQQKVNFAEQYATIVKRLPPVPDRAHRYNGVPRTRSLVPNSALITPVAASSDSCYFPLADGEIRILQISAGGPNDDLGVRLLNIPLTLAKGHYEAVSYAWGDSPASMSVEVLHTSVAYGNRSSRLTLRPNVFTMLQRFRKRDQDVCLWVDALCIDQTSASEKNKQVPMMADIYRSAERVLVWLGEGDGDLVSEIIMHTIGQTLTPGFLSDKNQRLQAWRAVRELTSRSWFSRRWVLQEIALAESVVLFSGSAQVNWNDLSDAIKLVEVNEDRIIQDLRTTLPEYQYGDSSSLTFINSGAREMIRVLDDLRTNSGQMQRMDSRQDLASLVTSLQAFASTDPRDIVYALLSLASDEHSIQADYTKCVLDVYGDFTEYAIRSSPSSLDIILQPWAPMRHSNQNSGVLDPLLQRNMPSWIPSVHDSPFGSPTTGRTRRLNANRLVEAGRPFPYRASNGKKPKAQIVRQMMHSSSDAHARESCTGILNVTGVILGAIDDLSTRMSEGIVLRECLEMGGFSVREGANIGNPPDKLWRTLVAGRNRQGCKDLSLCRLAFINLFHHISRLCSIDTTELLEDETLDRYIHDFLRRVQEVVWNRRMFAGKLVSLCESDAEVELFGMAPKDARRGDLICLLYGAGVPVILREVSNPKEGLQYVLVGEAYVDGFMEGEAFQGSRGALLEKQEQEFALC